MSFKDTLEDIRKNAHAKILASAINIFEKELERQLIDSAKYCLNTVKVDMYGELNNTCFKDLTTLVDLTYSAYESPYEKTLNWLLDKISKNPKFNGVSMRISNETVIHFKWSVSENEFSITQSLNNIIEENKILIINKAKTDFSNIMREKMKLVAGKGLSKGEFDFEFKEYQLLKRVLNINDTKKVYKWLIDKILEEQEDLKGINIYLNPHFDRIIFTW
jgi:hypothetical protein